MSGQSQWQHYQQWLYFHTELALYLDLSRMGLRVAELERQKAALQRALSAMAALEAGEIANPDESRRVGHYWLRDPARAPDADIRAAIEQDIAQVETFASAVHSGTIAAVSGARYSDILCIGIGGSALGPQLIADALAVAPPLAIHFMDNTDPDGIARLLAGLGDRLATTLVIVTSKSGSTPETRNGMVLTQACFRRAGLDFPRQAVAVTGRDSALDKVARHHDWLARFAMYDWVGGRTSVLSAVGLLPAALQGVNIRELLDGARLMDQATRATELRANPAAMMALAWYQAGDGRGARDMVVLPYRDALQLFGRYLQQLIMESLGKERDLNGHVVHQGLAVYGNKGSTDQHAYVQQLRDGLANFFVTFIEVLHDGVDAPDEVEPGFTAGDYLFGFLEGTRQALSENGRPSLTLSLPRVDARGVGALIALFERTVGLYASLINVNAYHQPGVEAGKKAAAEFLDLQREVLTILRSRRSGALSVAQLARQLGRDDVEAVFKVLRHLEASGRGVSLTGNRDRPDQLQVGFS